MAKCLLNKKEGKVTRVSDEEAQKMVSSGKWKYISKSDFRRIKTEQEG